MWRLEAVQGLGWKKTGSSLYSLDCSRVAAKPAGCQKPPGLAVHFLRSCVSWQAGWGFRYWVRAGSAEACLPLRKMWEVGLWPFLCLIFFSAIGEVTSHPMSLP